MRLFVEEYLLMWETDFLNGGDQYDHYRHLDQSAEMATAADDHRLRDLVSASARSPVAVRARCPDGQAAGTPQAMSPMSVNHAFFRQFTSTDRGKPWQIRI
jgi:hypothetical protein